MRVIFVGTDKTKPYKGAVSLTVFSKEGTRWPRVQRTRAIDRISGVEKSFFHKTNHAPSPSEIEAEMRLEIARRGKL
jgi:hypothetical protein